VTGSIALRALVAALLLAGCQLSLPGRGGEVAAPAAGAVAAEVIETSVLPEPGAAAAVPGAAAPAAAPAPEATPEPAPETPTQAAPAIPPALAAAAAACARTGGRLGPRGAGNASYACFSTPRDAGKSCSKAGDCSSACLARSLTCAPLQPLFGCHEVLTDRGQRVTQCLE